MAKRVSKRKQEKVLSPTELRRKMLVERKQREEQRAVLGILVPVLVLLAAFLAYGAYAELWREPRAPIARVEGETINAGRFQERIGWERVQLINSLESLRSLALSTDPSFINNMAAQQRSGLAQSTVDQMIDEALIRQEAEARGISVTEREVRNHIISTTLASILLATPEPVDEEPMTPIDEELDAADDAAGEDAAEAADEGESSEQDSEGDTMTGSADENGEETATDDDTVAEETAEDEAAADESAAMDAEAADDAASDEDAESEDPDSEDGEDDEDETSSLPDKPTDPDEVSDEDFDNAVENYLAGQFTTAGITRDDYFEIQRQAVYREKLNRALGEEIETTAPQIELDYLLFRDKATADAAAAALDAGQSWDEVVEEYGAPAEGETEEVGEDEASEDEASEDEASEDEVMEDEEAADDEAAADEADASTADEVSEDAVSEDELSEDEATADEADAGDETAEDEAADEPGADAEAEDETSEDEDSMEADAEDETAADDEDADDEAADDEPADDETVDDESADDDADLETDEEEAEPTASPSPIPAPTAEPFAFETGERRWYSRQQALQRLGLNEATADTVMSLETDASSEAIQGSRGFYVFRAVDREEARQLEEGELDTLRSTAVDDWLEERRLAADIQRFAYEDKVPAEPDWFLNAYNQITGSNQAMPTLAMPEVVGTAVPAPIEQEVPAPAGGEDASGDG